MESISPAELARTLLDDCLAGRETDPAAVAQLAGLALDQDEAIALIASRALLGTLVEGMADRFEPALCGAYAHLFAPVITRALPGLDGAALTARYESVRRVRPPAFEPAEVFVLSRVTLGADIAVTSILMDGARQRFPEARLWFAGPRKAWELFEGAGARWSFLDVPYGRTGLLRDRLAPFDALREALQRPGVLLLDPDSRLTQLGLLPVCPAGAHYLFESRGYGGETAATLPELARGWVRETLGVERAEPWFHPKYDHALPGRAVATVSFGIGENPAKRVPDPFEEETLRFLVESGWQVVLDTGAPGSEEDRRVRAAAARLGAAGAGIALHEGSFASFAAFIASSQLYVGYDSAGQHAAAAVDVPLVSIFGGFSCERMLERWSPDGLGPKRIIAVREQSVAELLRLTREAICEVTGRAS
ncbi:MAG: glycosyltransferase family 9 protein [Bryobacteraceae bacterium]